MHFPADRDINYYAQLTAERIVVKEAAGHKFRVWELPNGKANEALDCRVYAYGALCGLLHFGLKLNQRATLAELPYTEHKDVSSAVIAEKSPAVNVETVKLETAPVVNRKSLVNRLA